MVVMHFLVIKVLSLACSQACTETKETNISNKRQNQAQACRNLYDLILSKLHN